MEETEHPLDNHSDEKMYNHITIRSISFNATSGRELFKVAGKGEVTFISMAALNRAGQNLQDLIITIESFNSHQVILRADNLGIGAIINGKTEPILN